MNRFDKIWIFLGIGVFVLVSPVLGQQDHQQNKVFSYPDSFSLRNPFLPQLPHRIQKPIKPTQGPVKPTPTVTLPPSVGRKPGVPSPGLRPGGPKPAIEPDKTPEAPNWTISGIVWDTDRPQAIINGQVVDQGDIIDETEIVTIKKTGIEIIYKGNPMTIKP